MRIHKFIEHSSLIATILFVILPFLCYSICSTRLCRMKLVNRRHNKYLRVEMRYSSFIALHCAKSGDAPKLSQDSLKRKYQRENASPNSIRSSNKVYGSNSNLPSPTDSSYKYRAGDIVEYVSNKGCKRLALVFETKGIVSRRQSNGVTEQLKVVNELSDNSYEIPVNKITYHIVAPVDRLYSKVDLAMLDEVVDELQPSKVERLWIAATKAVSEVATAENNVAGVSLTYITQNLFKTSDNPLKLYTSFRLMNAYGKVYFERKLVSNIEQIKKNPRRQSIVIDRPPHVQSVQYFYSPLPLNTVQENLRDRAALREFKQRYNKIMTKTVNKNNGGSVSISSEIPDRVDKVLRSYSEGLKQLVYKNHPWVVNGWAKVQLNATELSRAYGLLEFLDLSPSLRNAKKVLEIMGVWSVHENVEKYIMQIRDHFPAEVMTEAQFLLDNWKTLQDPDERLRRDLRYLHSYAIDREGAAEVDDAVSIEYLENGNEKLWVHIADVSRWIRPGSQLSLEAECRMASVYMPDERISMFPDTLSTELLSLGAKQDSFAISCGVTLNNVGEVTSYEVCPSKIRVTHRLSYIQLDEILQIGRALGKDDEENSSDAISGGSISDIGKESIGGVKETNNESDDDNSSDAFSDLMESLKTVRAFSRNSRQSIRLQPPLNLTPLSTSSQLQSEYNSVVSELTRLYHWAVIRRDYRIRSGALDEYLRHKTELYLTVKRDPKLFTSINFNNIASSANMPATKISVAGYTSWSNASSMCLVSEYMILMSQTIGSLCMNRSTPVWFKTQVADPVLSPIDLELRPRETPFTRAARIMLHLRPSNDSKTPGPHCSSGSTAYVQCTSPIRRYHDLYNHYRLKAAMHEASLGAEWADRAREEAGITLLESMATAEKRLQKLNAIRMVTKNRDQYWLSVYMNKLALQSPKPIFDCIVHFANRDLPSINTTIHSPQALSETIILNGEAVYKLYDVIVMQLGSFTRYKMYQHKDAQLLPGHPLQCHLFKRNINPATYILLPIEYSSPECVHPSIGKEIAFNTNSNNRYNKVFPAEMDDE